MDKELAHRMAAITDSGWSTRLAMFSDQPMMVFVHDKTDKCVVVLRDFGEAVAKVEEIIKEMEVK